MKKVYESPLVELIPMLVDRAICQASSLTSTDDFTMIPGEFDDDSD